MEFKREAIIDKSIGPVWDVLGNKFSEAYKWASSLKHSEGFGEPSIEGAPCENRACATTQGNIKEVIRQFDPIRHILQYEVIEGFPFFVDTALNTWRLEKEGDKTHLYMHCQIKMKGVVGAVMTPMMKLQLSKLFDEAVEDFQYYVEHNGTPHPRKLKAMKKLESQAA